MKVNAIVNYQSSINFRGGLTNRVRNELSLAEKNDEKSDMTRAYNLAYRAANPRFNLCIYVDPDGNLMSFDTTLPAYTQGSSVSHLHVNHGSFDRNKDTFESMADKIEKIVEEAENRDFNPKSKQLSGKAISALSHVTYEYNWGE